MANAHRTALLRENAPASRSDLHVADTTHQDAIDKAALRRWVQDPWCRNLSEAISSRSALYAHLSERAVQFLLQGDLDWDTWPPSLALAAASGSERATVVGKNALAYGALQNYTKPLISSRGTKTLPADIVQKMLTTANKLKIAPMPCNEVLYDVLAAAKVRWTAPYARDLAEYKFSIGQPPDCTTQSARAVLIDYTRDTVVLDQQTKNLLPAIEDIVCSLASSWTEDLPKLVKTATVLAKDTTTTPADTPQADTTPATQNSAR